jgi:hypothetical protein
VKALLFAARLDFTTLVFSLPRVPRSLAPLTYDSTDGTPRSFWSTHRLLHILTCTYLDRIQRFRIGLQNIMGMSVFLCAIGTLRPSENGAFGALQGDSKGQTRSCNLHRCDRRSPSNRQSRPPEPHQTKTGTPEFWSEEFARRNDCNSGGVKRARRAPAPALREVVAHARMTRTITYNPPSRKVASSVISTQLQISTANQPISPARNAD